MTLGGCDHRGAIVGTLPGLARCKDWDGKTAGYMGGKEHGSKVEKKIA